MLTRDQAQRLTAAVDLAIETTTELIRRAQSEPAAQATLLDVQRAAVDASRAVHQLIGELAVEVDVSDLERERLAPVPKDPPRSVNLAGPSAVYGGGRA